MYIVKSLELGAKFYYLKLSELICVAIFNVYQSDTGRLYCLIDNIGNVAMIV